MKTILWRGILQKIKPGVVIGTIISIITVIIAWQVKDIQERQLKMQQQQAEWEKQKLENELAPTIKVDQKGTILLGKDEYTKYELYNSENNLAGGRLKEVNGVVMIACGEIRVKTLWIKDAVYKEEVSFDEDQQCATILLKERDTIERKAEILGNKISEGLQEQGAECGCEFDVRLGVVATLEYSDRNNDKNDQQYIVYLEEASYCETVDEGTVHCDQYYYLEYGKEDQGEEYEAVIDETVERIRQEYEGN